MMATLLIIAAAFAGGAWQFQQSSDPMGQPVYVAFVAPDEARPHVALRYLCGGVAGVVLQFNLGETEYDNSQYSTDEPTDEAVRFTFAEGVYDTTARRAPIVDGLGTYEIKGSEAAFVASLMTDSASVTVSRAEASLAFPLSGASSAIGEAMNACPYKYSDQ